MKNNTEHRPQNKQPGKKTWKTPELVLISQYDVNQPSDTWPGTGDNSQLVQPPAFYQLVKKALPVKPKDKK
ncbi:hypothetical protein BEL04_10785 [Mucilaginibacter sp. PPCGB 2223]|uniref:hypothetical protein n=1 Tax=Mucilaginibacter sp. PPCGB 2223 TaxID=1886027 RepID=UPI00082655F5|nr:hypothetical protein [Mucilaginibacter sp. PPCGB 2223]OCX54701.1 hypothetical protein BEL04_10785 [Mucilaginibacter sp. PPCGB 2223]